MNPNELKKKLAKLWKDTLHYPEQYISLILNNCVDPDFVEYEEVGGEVVAALYGYPYRFGNDENSINALFVGGIVTKPNFRSRGLMTAMLNRINEKAREKGFVFTFLIPQDPGLQKYYHDRDYVNAFYRVVDNYTSLHDFDREYESILVEQKEKVADLKRRLFRSLKTDTYDPADSNAELVKSGIKELIHSIEDAQQDLQIIHTDRDIDLIIADNEIAQGDIFYVANPSGKITAAAFTTSNETTVTLHKLFASDLASKYKVLGAIKTANAEKGICHYVSSIEMDRAALWMRTYGSFMKDANQVGEISITERVYSLAAHTKMYGMARILDFPEILKFQANCRHDLKYSILVKGDSSYTLEKISARDGKVAISKVTADPNSESQQTHVMTKRDIGEILFRRRDTDNLITEAFGIPSINGSINLLLD